MKKKLLVTLLMAVAACTSLTACGEDKEETKGHSKKEADKQDEAENDDDEKSPEKDNSGDVENNESSESNNNEANANEGDDEGNAPVLTIANLYYDSGSNTDDYGYEYSYEYNIPNMVGADTEYINYFNSCMMDIVENDVNDANVTMQDGYEPDLENVSFDAFYKDDYTTVIVTKRYIYDYSEYLVFVFDEYGNHADKKAVLSLFDIEEKQFDNNVFSIIEDRVFSNFYDMDDSYADDEYYEQLNECVEKTKNNLKSIEVYFTNEGLSFKAGVYVPAGAGLYDMLFTYE